MTDRGLGALFEAAPDIDRLILNRRQRLPATGARRARPCATSGRDGGFDLAIDLQGRPASAAWTYASGAAIKAGRGGFRPGWRFTQATDYRVSDTAESAAILERLGHSRCRSSTGAAYECGRRSGDRTVSARGRPARRRLPAGQSLQPLADQGLAAGRAMPSCCRSFAEPSIFRSRSRAGPVEARGRAPGRQPCRAGTAISLAGRLDLAQLLALLRRARLVLTGDSGPMHAADALGTEGRGAVRSRPGPNAPGPGARIRSSSSAGAHPAITPIRQPEFRRRHGGDSRGRGAGGGAWPRWPEAGSQRDPKATAVILPNWIGDGVMATPALQALRDAAGSGARIEGIRPGQALRPSGRAPRAECASPLCRPAAACRATRCLLSRGKAARRKVRSGIVLLSNGLGVALAAWLAGIPAAHRL